MIDRRLEKYANILVNHSLALKKDDLFVISGGILAAPLIKEVYKQAIEVGANPYARVGIDGLSEIFYKYSSEKQLKYVSPISKFEIKNIDAQLSIISPTNTRSMTNVDPKKQAISSVAHREIHDIFLDRAAKKELRWCLTEYPTNAAAQDAEMSLDEYENFIFNAAHVNAKDPIGYWKKVYREQEKIRKMLNTKKKIRVVAEDTDLTISVAGRKWINCYGKENFPDGEIFTGPIENSADGFISYSFPASHGGREVDDIQLWFKKGVVVKAKASKGEKFLHTMLDMDDGSRRIGEFAFGMNQGIKRYIKNTLFDEKIGGTIHIAVGSGYPETGSKNKSSLHWDMMCDLRKNGEVYADGELIYKKGRFL
ncbi:MAG: aminopeptidase [Candidatus Thermoplasmatota archaeon]|jgi:aminopeptidase|nr:aminopeptidase [Candidatus Thermoplasmatota archaeon]